MPKARDGFLGEKPVGELNTLICKGAMDEVMSLRISVEIKEVVVEVLPEHALLENREPLDG